MFGFNPYVLGAVVLAFVSLGGFASCEYQRAESNEVRAAAAEAARDTAIDANKSNQKTIDAQGKALDQWMQLGASPEEVAGLVAKANTFAGQLADAMTENAKMKEKDRANPECEKLLRVDFQRVCPNRARILRKYEGSYQNDHSESPGAGGGAGARDTYETVHPPVSLSAGLDDGRGAQRQD